METKTLRRQPVSEELEALAEKARRDYEIEAKIDAFISRGEKAYYDQLKADE